MRYKFTLCFSVALCLSATAALADDAANCERFFDLGQYENALQPCTAAAEQGLASAQNNLGFIYHNGFGVAQNYTEAVRWFRAAAEQGLAIAQHNLGLMYNDGLGVPQNFKKAHVWCNIAAANGAEGAAENRNAIAAQMTAQQISEAQSLAQQCINSNYMMCN